MYHALATDPLQFVFEIASGLPTLVGVLGETLAQHAIERGRGDVGDGRGGAFHDPCNHARRGGAVKHALAGEHFIEHDAEGEDVAAGVDFLAGGLRA